MARQKVELIKCDRCRREELQPVGSEEKKVSDFECTFKGSKIVYTDLCGFCTETIKNHIEAIREWTREMNSLLNIKTGPKVQANEAPPVSTSPDYSPPKPHSAAATKR